MHRRKRALPPPPGLREEGAEATTPALTEPSAVVTDGGAPAKGGSARELTWRSPPIPPQASASPRHATACFATSPFLFGHLTAAFLHTTNAYRRMHSNHRNPGAHEDVYTEFGGLPHVCSGVVVEWGDSEPIWRNYTTVERRGINTRKSGVERERDPALPLLSLSGLYYSSRIGATAGLCGCLGWGEGAGFGCGCGCGCCAACPNA